MKPPQSWVASGKPDSPLTCQQMPQKQGVRPHVTCIFQTLHECIWLMELIHFQNLNYKGTWEMWLLKLSSLHAVEWGWNRYLSASGPHLPSPGTLFSSFPWPSIAHPSGPELHFACLRRHSLASSLFRYPVSSPPLAGNAHITVIAYFKLCIHHTPYPNNRLSSLVSSMIAEAESVLFTSYLQ